MGDADRERDKEETLDAVRHALSGLRYGSVEIIVHDSKVVQIERKEKLRLNHVSAPVWKCRKSAGLKMRKTHGMSFDRSLRFVGEELEEQEEDLQNEVTVKKTATAVPEMWVHFQTGEIMAVSDWR